jgi:hypothetical protein
MVDFRMGERSSRVAAREGWAMTETIVLWLLVAVSDGGNNRGTVSVVERFVSKQACEDVSGQIPRAGDNVLTRCIRAELPARFPQR